MFKRLITLTLILGVFSILIKLGLWQVDRLAWKTDIIKQMNAHKAIDITSTTIDLTDTTDGFKRGYINGALIGNPNTFIHLCPRTYDSAVGCHIYSAIDTSSETSVIVNLGWLESNQTITMPETFPTQWRGYMRTPDSKGAFTPANRPNDNLWYWADIPAMKKALNISGDVYPQIMYLETPYAFGNLKPFQGLPQPRNKHRQYAIFWFGMSGLWLALCGFAFYRSRNRLK